MSAAQAGFLVAGVAAALYGLVLQRRPPDWRRTLVKAAFAGALAVAARFADAPPLLALALGLSALGDGALAIDPRRTLAGGLMARLLARIAYVALFLEIGTPAALLASPLRLAGAVAAFAAAGAAFAWLRPGIGLRAPAAVFALAASAAAASALTLPDGFAPAMAGAALLLASDAALAASIVREEDGTGPLAGASAWWLYVAAQAAIAWSFLQPWRL